MRLIDADKLVEEMKSTPPNAYTVGHMIYLAENAPTVYDANKVVEQLENCEDCTTFRYSKGEGVLYEVEADVWARVADGTETEIVINNRR